MRHELKADPAVYPDLALNLKRVEVRRDDRTPPYAVGDELYLRETKYSGEAMAGVGALAPLEYTGKACRRIITHRLTGEQYGIAEGFVALSVRPLHKAEKEAVDVGSMHDAISGC